MFILSPKVYPVTIVTKSQTQYMLCNSVVLAHFEMLEFLTSSNEFPEACWLSPACQASKQADVDQADQPGESCTHGTTLHILFMPFFCSPCAVDVYDNRTASGNTHTRALKQLSETLQSLKHSGD